MLFLEIVCYMRLCFHGRGLHPLFFPVVGEILKMEAFFIFILHRQTFKASLVFSWYKSALLCCGCCFMPAYYLAQYFYKPQRLRVCLHYSSYSSPTMTLQLCHCGVHASHVDREGFSFHEGNPSLWEAVAKLTEELFHWPGYVYSGG